MNFDKFYDYEKALPDERIKQLGIVYTPHNIVDYINNKALDSWNKDYPPRVCDFSCGTGVFLMDMANKIAKRWHLDLDEVMSKYIFGNDLDESATTICKELLGCANISTMDGLDYDISKYDIIVANPPYVRMQNCDDDTKEKISTFSWCVGDTDLYIAFLEKIMKSGKIYGLICPNSWIKNKFCDKVRSFVLQSQTVSEIIDFRNKLVFDKVQAYCSIIVGSPAKHRSFEFKTDIDFLGEPKLYDKVTENTFYLTNQEVADIREMDNASDYFLDHFNFNVGLATQRDKIYFLSDVSEQGNIVHCPSKNINVEKAVTKVCYKNGKFSRYNGRVQDRIIYPYDDNDKPLGEEVFKSKYPLAYQYLFSKKAELLKRDGGKFKKKYEDKTIQWYEYGRTQGLSINEEKILIGTIGQKVMFMKVSDGLFISGYAITEKENSPYSLSDAISIIESDAMTTCVRLRAKPLSGGYYQINKQFFKSIKFNGVKDD